MSGRNNLPARALIVLIILTWSWTSSLKKLKERLQLLKNKCRGSSFVIAVLKKNRIHAHTHMFGHSNDAISARWSSMHHQPRKSYKWSRSHQLSGICKANRPWWGGRGGRNFFFLESSCIIPLEVADLAFDLEQISSNGIPDLSCATNWCKVLIKCQTNKVKMGFDVDVD